MTGLLVSMFVLILCLSMLGLVQNDNVFELHQEALLRAALTARAGIELYKDEAEMFVTTPTVTRTLDDPDFLQIFVVTADAAGNVTSVGTVTSRLSVPPKVLAAHTVKVLSGDFTHLLDTSQ